MTKGIWAETASTDGGQVAWESARRRTLPNTWLAAGLVAVVLSGVLSNEAPAASDVGIRLFGVVFDDANGNGKQDAGEKGIAGVRVGDFWTTALTDANGAYDFQGTVKLSISPAEIPNVYVAVPPGYTVYRVADYFRRIVYTGKTEFKADFGLKADPKTLEKEFCWVTAGDADTYERLVRYVTPIANAMDRKPAFMVSTGDTFLGRYGDITYDEDVVDAAIKQCGITAWDESIRKDPGRLEQIRASITKLHAAMNMRMVNCKGNHENHCFEEVLGPPCYSFHWGGVCFLIRGTWLGGAGGDWECTTFWQTREAQEDWFNREVKLIPAGTPCVVIAHYKEGVTDAMWKAMADRGLIPAGRLWAHSHRSCVEWLDIPGGGRVHAMDVGGTPGRMPRNKEFVPQGFFVATMKDGKIGETYEPDGMQDFMCIVSPAASEEVAPVGMNVAVNAGGTLTTAKSARCRVDNGEWTDLKRTGRYSWVAEGIKPGIAGTHRVQVEAVTLDGKTLTAAVRVVSKEGVKAAAVKTGDDWIGLGGNDANTGDVGATGKLPLRLSWSRNVGAPTMLGGIVVVKGRVHALLARYGLDQRAGIATLDAASGTETGFCDFSGLKASLLTTHWLQYDSGALVALYPYSSSSWSPGNSTAVAVEEGTGASRWSASTGGFPVLKVSGGKVLGTTLTAEKVNGKRVPYLHLKATDGRTKKLAWTSDALCSDPEDYDMESHGFEVPAVDSGANRAYMTSGCVSLDDGKAVWKANRDRLIRPGVWAPVVAMKGGKLFAHGEAWDADTGDAAWSHPRTDPELKARWLLPALSAVGESTAVFAWEDGVVRGHVIADGARKWETKTALPFMGGLAAMGGTVYGVSRTGVVVGLDIETGKEAWRCDLGTPIFAAPAASGNTLFVADWGGNVYAFAGQ